LFDDESSYFQVSLSGGQIFVQETTNFLILILVLDLGNLSATDILAPSLELDLG